MNQVKVDGISVDQLQQLFKNAVRPQETNHVIPEFVEYNPHEASERLKSILDGSVEFLKENKQVKTAERTHNFIITSHTTGQNQAIREKLLRDLVTSLKHYFPGCYVVVGSASDVPQDIIDIADCVFFDKIQRFTPPAYHGNGELQLVKEGLRVMQEKGKEWCVKFTYDFIINDSNFNMINEWAKIADTQNKEFVGTTWVDIKGSQWDVALQQNTVGTWLYYGKVSFLKDVFDTMQLDDIIERKVTQAFMGKSDKAFLYPSANDMLGGTWEECGDLITNAGNNIKPSFEKKQAVTPRGVNDKPRVLCYVCTKDRFFTTLPMTLTSLVLQTRVPDHLIIFEDGEHKDLNEVPYYKAMFETLGRKGCTVWMQYEQGKGQNVLDQKANMQKGYHFVWRYDDDEVAEHDVLERMLKYFENNPKLGAVGGFVGGPLFGNGVATGKLENIFSEQNVQWHNGNAVYENVDHLHSSFLYRPGIVNFHQDLSPVSHRGETIFTASLKRAGYQLIVDQTIKIWHYRAAGGIRSHDNVFLYDHDEKKFMDKLEEWGYRICVLDNGIGDHAIFLGSILPELQKKYPHLILSVCYPEIFSGKLRPGDSLISIGQAPNPARLRDDVYTGLAEGRLKGSLQDAFRQLYLEDGKEK